MKHKLTDYPEKQTEKYEVGYTLESAERRLTFFMSDNKEAGVDGIYGTVLLLMREVIKLKKAKIECSFYSNPFAI